MTVYGTVRCNHFFVAGNNWQAKLSKREPLLSEIHLFNYVTSEPGTANPVEHRTAFSVVDLVDLAFSLQLLCWLGHPAINPSLGVLSSGEREKEEKILSPLLMESTNCFLFSDSCGLENTQRGVKFWTSSHVRAYLCA